VRATLNPRCGAWGVRRPHREHVHSLQRIIFVTCPRCRQKGRLTFLQINGDFHASDFEGTRPSRTPQATRCGEYTGGKKNEGLWQS